MATMHLPPLQRSTFDEARKVHCTLHKRHVWTRTIWTSGPSQLCDHCYRVLRHG